MHNYYICDNCYKPVIEEETNIILHDLRVSRNTQYYCGECFASINYDMIQKKSKYYAKIKESRHDKSM